jgi:pimeloyl-ACP methyl ester carboxylesterase
VAENLHSLLSSANIDGQLIMVGHSLGGIYVRSFAERWPHRVVGMVLIESAHENQTARMPPEIAESQDGLMRFLAICRVVAPFGVLRIANVAEGYTLGLPFTEEQRGRVVAVMNRTGYCAGVTHEFEAAALDVDQVDPPPSLGDIPLIVLSAGVQDSLPSAAQRAGGITPDIMRAANAAWNQMQEELATLSTRGTREIAAESEHYIQYDQPELVVDAVRRIVVAARDQEAGSATF